MTLSRADNFRIDDLSAPSLLRAEDVMLRNIERLKARLKVLGVPPRPHHMTAIGAGAALTVVKI